MSQRDPYAYNGSEIAIIGFAGRFPGARDVEELWSNLCDGVESVRTLSDAEMLADGVDAEEIAHPQYVKRAAPLEEIDLFDAAFFGFTPREAELMDPQQRVFLEIAWQALEHAGYDPARVGEPIGVFAGGKMGTYLFNLSSNPELFETLDNVTLGLGNDIALLAMRTAFKLDTKGPAYFVQSACSTSLAAVHLACQSLLIDECRMALAGAVAIDVPNRRGYVYQESGILAADGHVRAFDEKARGTIFGSGAGAVILKRLEDAIADGDQIHAVIKGSATNNDGARKAAFTAPAVEGQADVILRALINAEVPPETITYLEAHGTGTQLGDPVEIRAITKAWRAGTDKNGFCWLGTAKANLGHLDAAAGIAGLIKTTLALERGVLPPLLHFAQANPQIDFAATPFKPLREKTPWPSNAGRKRRAAVSAFGFGGTNAHLILEEAEAAGPSAAGRPSQLIVLSAKTAKSLEMASEKLAGHLRHHPEQNFADTAFTLLAGRAAMPWRRIVVAGNSLEAATLLESAQGSESPSESRHAEEVERPLAFLFSGQGAQYAGMTQGLYEAEPTFRACFDACAEILLPLLGRDLRTVVFAPGAEGLLLEQTELAQPALFSLEISLAHLLEEWGLKPAAMLGHSLGEYVAATLAGVFEQGDALRLVALRGKLMGQMAPGKMLTVSMRREELAAILPATLSLAAVNGERRLVVSGPEEEIALFEAQLAESQVAHRRLHTSHAFHSAMMEGMLEEFRAAVAKVPRQAPQLPFVSNLTGKWISSEQAQEAGYWADHLRSAVLFADGLETLREEADFVYLEVGPGNTLASLAKAHFGAQTPVFSTVRHPNDQRPDLETLLLAAGRLFLAGAPLNAEGFFRHEERRRVPLPTYSFDRRRFWIAAGKAGQGQRRSGRKLHQIDAWFHLPSFRRSLPLEEAELPQGLYLILPERGGKVAHELARRLEEQGREVFVAPAGLDPLDPHAYAELLDSLAVPVRGIFHLANLDDPPGEGVEGFFAAQAQGSYSLLHLGQALARPRSGARSEGAPGEVMLLIAAHKLFDLTGGEEMLPEKAPLGGAAIVLGQEQGQIACRVVDLGAGSAADLAEILLLEAADSALAKSRDVFTAWRGRKRHLLTYERTPIAPASESPLRERGVYAITGGLGAVARLVALDLARRAKARLVLIGRSQLPPREEWQSWLAAHGDTERTSRKLLQVLELEAAGAEVLVASADATDAAQLSRAFAAAQAKFGTLHGVIHMAGALEGDSIYRTFTDISRQAAEEQFLPKGKALYALERALEPHEVDFCLLFSSNASVLGGLGFFAYAAANAFLDAFAASRSRTSGKLWISASWDEWPAQAIAGLEIQTSMSELAMTADEGTEALVRLLSRREGGHVAVSTGDLAARLDIWVRRDRLASGKKAEVHARPELKTTYEAPASELEGKIAELWQELLGIETVGINDNFFDLGGHSLLATQLMSRLRGLAGVEVPLQKLFEAPTVRGIAAATEELLTLAGLPAAGSAVKGEDRDESADEIPVLARPLPPQPLSLAQERMYFLNQLDDRTSIYNLLTAVRLEGRVDVDLLEASFRALLERHESLRTTFESIDQVPHQVIHAEIHAEIERLDLQAEAEPEGSLRQLTRERHGRPFDLAKGPLLRFALARLGPRDVVFLLVMHHIISDGWSMSVLVRELTVLYEAAVKGKKSPLPPLRLQYPDVAAWQRQRLTGEWRSQLIEFWRRQLDGELEPLLLPTDVPRSRGPAVRLEVAALELPESLGRAVRELGKGKRSTPFMILLAAFGTLLYRYSGQRDLRIGTPIANRNHKEMEGILGFLLNTLVLRLRFDGSKGFADLLRQTQEMALGAFAHQDLPLEVLMHELGLEDRGQGFFQLMFLYQNVPPPRLDLPDVELSLFHSDVEAELGAMAIDWTLVVDEVGDAMRLSITYNGALFAQTSIERALRHLQVLLEGALADPQRPLDELPLTSAAERRAEERFAGTRVPLDSLPVALQIAARAAEDAARPALFFDGGMWTRGELESRSNQLAHHLIAAGAGHEVLIGLLLERSPELIAAMLAVHKAGAAYIPIDPAQPLERSLELLGEAKAPLLITNSETLQASPELGAGRRVILVDGDAAHIAARPAALPGVPLFAEGAAYVIFTSGSTGRPKGVLVPQRALANFVAAAAKVYPIGEDDRVLQFASLAFDTSAEEIYPVLARGGALALRTEEMIAFPEVLLGRCREWGITVLDLPTAFWHEMVSALESAGQKLGAPLRLLILGGERPLPEKLAAFGVLHEKGLRLLNTYGPTEATVVATCADLSPHMATWPAEQEAGIGLPLPNVVAHVMDARIRPQPLGIAGELYLGGEGLARGYLFAPALTAQKFLPDPCSEIPGARLYRSGDRARRRDGGELEFLGRVDFQVKIHGYRVEPGEIEAVLAEYPGLSEVAVLALGEAPRLELHAFASPAKADAEPPSGKELRHFLAERLAGHLVPTACHVIAKLPKTISGKIDRKALAALGAGALLEVEAKAYIAPRNDAEEIVCSIFTDILGLEEVSVDASFFELGGHSLLLMQVLHQLQDTFEVQFPLRRLYADPTPEGIAALAEGLLIEAIEAEEGAL